MKHVTILLVFYLFSQAPSASPPDGMVQSAPATQILINDTLDVIELSSTLSKVSTNKNNLPKREFEKLSSKIVKDNLRASELRETLIQFYQLTGSDLEKILEVIRKNFYLARVSKNKPVKPIAPEADVSAFCHQLNTISIKQYGIPFHLAALKGNDAEFISLFNNRVLRKKFDSETLTVLSCPYESFPSFLSWSALGTRLATKSSCRVRTEDNLTYTHVGGFNGNGNLKNWSGTNPAVLLMANSNGWGNMKLLANVNNLAIKQWTMLVFGLTQFHLLLFLNGRK